MITPLIHRPLGQTGLFISPVSLGCSSFGSRISAQQSIRIIGAALELGVTTFDTAPLYGSGTSEGILGRTLPRLGTETIIISKFGREPPRLGTRRFLATVARPLSKQLRTTACRRTATIAPARSSLDFSAARARASLERSLKRLRRDALDILLFHSPSVQHLAETDAPALLDSLVNAGKIRMWGVSADDSDVASLAMTIPGCSVLEYPFNPACHDFVASGATATGVKLGMGLLARSPFNGGRLLSPNNPRTVKEGGNASSLLLYSLHHSGATSVIVAPGSTEHLTDLVCAIQSRQLNR